MKKIVLGVALVAVCFSVWAQAPETVNIEYKREAIHYNDGKHEFINSDVFFKLDSLDKETGLDYVTFAIDDTNFMKYENPFHILEEGPHELFYKGYDNGRNKEVAKTYAFIVDNTAPTVKINTDVPLYGKGFVKYVSAETKWFVTASDNVYGSGVAAGYIGTDVDSLEIRGNGRESEDEDSYINLTEEGPTKVYYTAIDNVGNLAPISLFSVIVDTTPPEVMIESNNRLIRKEGVYTEFPTEQLTDEDGRIIISSNEPVAFSATDNLSGVEAIYVKINDEEYTKYVEPIELNSNEIYDIEVKAIDNVGNVSEPIVYQFYVDKISPASEVQLINKEGEVLETIGTVEREEVIE